MLLLGSSSWSFCRGPPVGVLLLESSCWSPPAVGVLLLVGVLGHLVGSPCWSSLLLGFPVGVFLVLESFSCYSPPPVVLLLLDPSWSLPLLGSPCVGASSCWVLLLLESSCCWDPAFLAVFFVGILLLRSSSGFLGGPPLRGVLLAGSYCWSSDKDP